MPRPLWKGTVSFGLVSVPVEIWSAVRGSHRISFREIHVEDGSPVRHVRYCEAEDKPVDPSETGRAYELDGRLIPISDEELEELEPEKTQTIEIESFTPRAQIDPVRFDHPYYLVPGDETVGTIRAYRLLVAAMSEGDLLALGKFVMRSREYLAAIRVYGDGLGLSTMHFPAEIRSADDLPGPAEAPDREELENAISVIGERTTEWDPDAYEDRHRARLMKVIDRKRKGTKVKAPRLEEKEEGPTTAPDLMAALKKTLAESRGKRRSKRDLTGLSKHELYELASERGLKGRSSMNKQELLRALRR